MPLGIGDVNGSSGREREFDEAFLGQRTINMILIFLCISLGRSFSNPLFNFFFRFEQSFWGVVVAWLREFS